MGQARMLVVLAAAMIILLAWYFLFHVPAQITLLLWNADSDIGRLETNRSSIDLERHGDNWRLRLETSNEVEFSGVTIAPPTQDWWDGSDYQFVVVEVSNAGSEPCEVGIRINGVAETPDLNLSNRISLILPGETRQAKANLYATPWTYRDQPNAEAMRVAPGQPLFPGYGYIKSVTVYVRQTQHRVKHQLLIGDVRLETPVQTRSAGSFFPIVDRYGQLKATNWPGKITSDNQLIRNLNDELSELKLAGRPESWSKWGGWLDGPQLESTGAFRTEKVNGEWWLVDPDGYLFWSHGVDAVSTAYSATGTQDREQYFEWLPPNNLTNDSSANHDPMGDFYHQAGWAHGGFYQGRSPYWSYNFLVANLHRQLGTDWQYAFEDIAHRRLSAWRMNTMAAWSDPLVTSWQKTAYTEFVRISDCPFIEGSRSNWQPFVDVYAPEFENAVTTALKTRAAAFDDPWCIGFFVDNELSWGDAESLADGVIRSPPTQPAKQQWGKFLKQWYSTVALLNESWKSDFARWDELLDSRTIPEDSTDKTNSLEDRIAFSKQMTDRYFSVIASKLNEFAPDRLYLGCRFFWKNDEVLKIAAKYCDVVSINVYHFLAKYVYLPDGVDKPIVVGEFHFGATDRGMLHPTNVPADDQDDRANKYRGFVESALENPAIVGEL